MAAISALKDTTEMVELAKWAGLYLKPQARLNISVALPQLKVSSFGPPFIFTPPRRFQTSTQ